MTAPTVDLETSTDPDEPRGRRRSVAPWIAAGAAVAVTALVAGGLAQRGGDGAAPGGEPPLLRIGSGLALGDADVTTEPGGVRAGRYLFTGAFPTTPGPTPVHRLPATAADAALVARLAAALGMTAEPQRDGDSWLVRQGRTLRVYDAPGVPFAYDAEPGDGACPGLPTSGYDDPDSAVGCEASPQLGGPAVTPAPGPGAAATRQAAQAFAAAVGLDGAVTVWAGSPYSGATIDPPVGSAPTTGFGTQLLLADDGIRAAHGQLAPTVPGAVEPGAAYPLRSAKDAFAALATMPMPAIACPEEQSADPICGGDVTLTAVSLGSMLAYDDGRPVLVPAWLFATDDGSVVAQVAVLARYLADPTTDDPGGSGGGSTPGSTGSAVEPGAPGTAGDPDQPAPDEPTVGVDPATNAVGTISWTGPRTLELTLTGGCELDTAVGRARTTPDAIVLTYAYDPISCPMDIGVIKTLEVTLDEPADGRPVVDENGRPYGETVE